MRRRYGVGLLALMTAVFFILAGHRAVPNVVIVPGTVDGEERQIVLLLGDETEYLFSVDGYAKICGHKLYSLEYDGKGVTVTVSDLMGENERVLLERQGENLWVNGHSVTATDEGVAFMVSENGTSYVIYAGLDGSIKAIDVIPYLWSIALDGSCLYYVDSGSKKLSCWDVEASSSRELEGPEMDNGLIPCLFQVEDGALWYLTSGAGQQYLLMELDLDTGSLQSYEVPWEGTGMPDVHLRDGWLYEFANFQGCLGEVEYTADLERIRLKTGKRDILARGVDYDPNFTTFQGFVQEGVVLSCLEELSLNQKTMILDTDDGKVVVPKLILVD